MGFASPQKAMAFYGEAINRHDFDALLPALSNEVTFWFSTGTHSGLLGSRQAFEAIWSRIVDEHYWLENLEWIALGEASAACTYRFRWRGLVGQVMTQGGGRGTSVLRLESGGWVIIHEHLSAEPT